MILCIDAGNTQLFGGIYSGEKIILRFRKRTREGSSSDEIGIFLKNVLIANELDPKDVEQIAICSVVPDENHSLASACEKYFKLRPFFLRAGIKSGLKIKYKNPLELGADRIATSIGSIKRHPGKNIIIIDMGTATTFDIINKNREHLGGAIFPGLRISMDSLEQRTAKLPKVEIIRPLTVCGRSTVENIQSGLYYGAIGQLKELISRFTTESFQGEKPIIIGTGGFSSLFKDEKIFDYVYPDLVLEGINKALELNR
ncbi:type III pantothenate kinase [Thiospirochaeta perfilievii]|uniref:Type III pantothenate kinase n=1 Tax=Thiospirochaeta perfilievii TaxID=252967 RepID=A0A5C1QE82_9SPIO|nr:type III pantothenate kinase [Thiospirochaeta perfilievii]QEN04522.1 type III pantothenate kinase [Thiospirochaeta perfilievii]